MAETYRFVDEEQPEFKFVDEPAPQPTTMDRVKHAARLLSIANPILAPGRMMDAISNVAYDVGGKVTDIASPHMPAEAAAGLGVAANVGIQSIPTILSGPIGKSAAPAFKEGGRALMQSAAKPTLEQLRTGKAARAIETMLKEGYNPTSGGVAKMKTAISGLNDEIAEAIATSPATVDKGRVAGYLQDAVKKFEMQVNPSADVKAIESAWTEFMSHPMLAGRSDIPVQLAQKLKQGTYKALGDKSFGELKGASTEAQKALARGLKEEISAAVPNVAALNKRESDLLNALTVAERRALIDANKNPVGLGPIAGHPGWMAAFLADRSAWLKAMLGRGLYSGSEQIPAAATRAGVGAYMASQNKPALSEDAKLEGALFR